MNAKTARPKSAAYKSIAFNEKFKQAEQKF